MHMVRRLAYLTALTLLLGPRSAAGQDDIRSRLLTSVDQLAASLDDPNLVLLHVGERAEYDAGHIAGARYIQLTDISAPRPASPSEGLVLELPAATVLEERLEGFGISDDSRIVVYYGSDWVTPSTRVLLTLEYAGLDNVSLLDGGMEAWKAADRPVTAEAAPERHGQLSPLRTREVVVTADWVLENLDHEGISIVDARAPRFYEGQYESADQRPGHIAGARSIPFSEIVDETLKLKSTDALRALFREAGVGDTDTVITYCHIGQQATTVLFAARLLGHRVMLYDGSYTEWGVRADLPIEKAGGGSETATADGGRNGSPTSGAFLARPLLAPALLTRRAIIVSEPGHQLEP